MSSTTIGCHGCSREKEERLLRGEFVPSDAAHDWLGDGLYFWERGPARAWEWAQQRHPGLPESELTVAVAEIDLGNCLDLTDLYGTRWLSAFVDRYEGFCEEARIPIRANEPKRLYLDGGFIRWATKEMEIEAGQRIYVIRAAYSEGEPLIIGGHPTHLQTHSHVQLCVRDPSVISWRL